MISLCLDFKKIDSAIECVNGPDYIKSVMNLYLDSYGTKYDFCQFYLCVNNTDDICAVVLRYNSYIYVLSNDNADSDELFSFLSGFSKSVLYCDYCVAHRFDDVKVCYIMRKQGEKSGDLVKVSETSDSPFKIAELVCKNMSVADREDFFLNTAHQLRYGALKAFAIIAGDRPISVAGVSKCYRGTKAITFVYTDEYFRGNGYSRDVLSAVCSDTACFYELMCEEHNVKFYKKCGFIQAGICHEIRL